MRRAQSVRTYPRTSLSLTTPTSPPTDLPPLHEPRVSDTPTLVPPTLEDLQKQLLEKERENDKLHATILTLQSTLASRPPLQTLQTLEKEAKNLDLILQGTQRENERCMQELERMRTRERLLEQALAKLAGENWQEVLDLGTVPVVGTVARAMGASLLGRATATPPPQAEGSETASQASVEATLSQMEQIRLLVLGMEQRMQEREEKLTKTIERAEAQETKCETLRREVVPTKVAA